MLPPTSWMAAFRAAFPFRAAVPLRTETASFRLTPPRRCPGQHFRLSCPPHQQHARPSTRVARPGWPSAWCLSPASYVSDFFFFNLCGLCNCSLLYTLVLKGYTGRLSRSLSLSLSFQKLPRSHLPSQFAFVGFQLLGFYYCLFLWKCFFSLECLLVAVIKYFKYLKGFCFASLCFVLQLNMEWT